MIKVMIAGLPGNLPTLVAEQVQKAEDMMLLGFGLAKERGQIKIGDELSNTRVFLRPPKQHKFAIKCCHLGPPDIIIDFPTPESVERNVGLYCECEIPFVVRMMGGDKELLFEKVRESKVSAVFIESGSSTVILKAIRVLARKKGEKGKVFLM